MKLFNNLNEVKEALFDAPVDVKSSFNNVVQYFSKSAEKWVVASFYHSKSEFEKDHWDVAVIPYSYFKEKNSEAKYDYERYELLNGPYDNKDYAERVSEQYEQ